MSKCTLIQGDCIEEMQKLIDEGIKVDLVLTDLPYGTTQCRWDNIIPFEPMWDCIHELVHQKTPVLLFGQEPFSSHLRLSNLKEFRYDWVWNKLKGTNFLNANRTPLPCHEVISVFYQRLPYYNPQKRYVGVKSKGRTKEGLTHKTYGKVNVHTEWKDDGYRFPLSVIECDKSRTEARNGSNVHPTQKPVWCQVWPRLP
jgi:site-specific DNA-methyltransferase (adenine-specific)